MTEIAVGIRSGVNTGAIGVIVRWDGSVHAFIVKLRERDMKWYDNRRLNHSKRHYRFERLRFFNEDYKMAALNMMPHTKKWGRLVAAAVAEKLKATTLDHYGRMRPSNMFWGNVSTTVFISPWEKP